MILTIELFATLIAMTAGVCGIILGLRQSGKNGIEAAKMQAEQTGKILQQLESIGREIRSIREDIRGERDRVNDHEKRIIALEQKI